MIPTSSRVWLALLATLTVTVANKQLSDAKQPPVSARPYFTAFPGLMPVSLDPDTVILVPVLPEVPTNAGPLQKVRLEQARVGLLYLARLKARMQNNSWHWENFYEQLVMPAKVYRVAAELEDNPANRIRWYEEWVRTTKEFEEFIERRVLKRIESPLRLNLVRYFRLQAELELITLKDSTASAGGGTGRELTYVKPDARIPKVPTDYTAFPDLKPRTYEQKTVTNPDGTTRTVGEEKGVVPLPHLPVLPIDAPMFRKLRHEQVLEGFAYLKAAAVWIFDAPRDVYSLPFWSMTADTYRTAAELEDRLPDRVPWYEARVRAVKLAERYSHHRVQIGSDPPQKFDLFQFHRLQAEAELLQLKVEVEATLPTTKLAPVREPSAFKELEPVDDEKPRPHFTAFPDLKPRTIEEVVSQDSDGKTRRVYRDRDVVPLPPLPVVATNTPLARKVQFEQAQEGLEYLERMRENVLNNYASEYFLEYLHMATEVYRVAADLEDTPTKRVPWFEARVRTLKDIERFTDNRAKIGLDPKQRFNAARFHRLRAEAELLTLKAEVEKAPVRVNAPMCCYPTPCAPTRNRFLPRLLHCR